ncbi:MAG: hypothetical protein B6I36_10340 [Desulfobacteraceae bacterium 4572_35.1]|nr:MAG: hypothetical protein B6I36_10340 [Desulfobacteraceae bacterium 4572_35.1]
MDFNSTNHVYRCVPPVLGIKEAYDSGAEKNPVVFGLKCIPMPEVDEDVFKEAKIRSEKTPDESQRIIAGYTKDRIKSKVAFIENLVLDGNEITDFDSFYNLAPPELVSWVCKAVYSSYVLSVHEIKN